MALSLMVQDDYNYYRCLCRTFCEASDSIIVASLEE